MNELELNFEELRKLPREELVQRAKDLAAQLPKEEVLEIIREVFANRQRHE